MNENEKPVIGSTEAAVLTVVELIARAASMSEQHVSYWLDLYYQVRSRYEFEHALTLDDMVIKKEEPDPVMARLDELEKKIDELKNGVTLKMDVRPVHPAPYRTAEDVIRIRPEDLAADQDPAAAFIKQFAEADEAAGPSRAPAPTGEDWERAHKDALDALPFVMAEIAPAHAPGSVLTATLDDYALAATGKKLVKTPLNSAEKAEEEPTPVMRGRETIKLQERAKSESRSEAVKKQKAAEREFKIRVAERLREARTHGVKIGEIVTASCGKVPDGAVLTILDGGFRPIADYRALDAALDQLAKDNTSSVTAEP